MKHILATALLVSLTACATGPTPYGPAERSSDVGFENTKIESDRFRISYTARNPDVARHYALLRAAEIATTEGYSHFRVIAGDQYVQDRGRSGVSTSVGVGTGWGGRRSGTSVGVGVNIFDLGNSLRGEKVTESIEIKLMNVGSDEPNVFDAAEVQANIQPPVYK